MDFFSIILFLVLFYIRPHEWIPPVAHLKPVMVSMALAIFTMFNRKDGFSAKQLFKTPHDWMMLCYFLWVVFSAPHPLDALGKSYNVFIFYFVTVQALSTIPRLQKFLTWWTFLVFSLSLLALASEFGFDPMGSYDLTHGVEQNRLSLNTSLFNNPNALGHSVAPCLMMLYYVCYWKRPVFSKIATVPLVAVVLYCIYLTVSKGAFLSTFASLVIGYSFGRPRTVQITILFLAMTVGYGALYNLPRMNELKKAQADAGIQGRLAAWEFGMQAIQTKVGGLGLGNFVHEFNRKHTYSKASHGSYVQVGAETGYIGLFFYLGILYCNMRSLIVAKTSNIGEERIRRMIFAFLCSYIISSWMVDFGFRATYFLITAASAAFHRQMLLKRDEMLEIREEMSVNIDPAPIGFPRAIPAGAMTQPIHFDSISMRGPDITVAPSSTSEAKENKLSKITGVKWNRIGVVDFVIMIGLVFAAVLFWRYLMHHI